MKHSTQEIPTTAEGMKFYLLGFFDSQRVRISVEDKTQPGQLPALEVQFGCQLDPYTIRLSLHCRNWQVDMFRGEGPLEYGDKTTLVRALMNISATGFEMIPNDIRRAVVAA